MTTFPSDKPSTRRRVSPAWAAAGAVGLVVVALLAYSIATGPRAALQPGQVVPFFKLPDLQGHQIEVGAGSGEVVVINFFASWCAPCREEAADLENAWQQYQAEGVQFYGIAYKDARSKVQGFLDQFDVTYPCAPDAGGRTARAYGVTGVPETFVIDGQGRLQRHIVGATNQEELSLVIDQALGR